MTVVRHEDAHPYSTAPTSTRALTVRAWAAAGHPTAEQLAAGTADRPVNLIQVLAAAKALIGVPYRFGGETPNGFDCSGYVRFVYAQTGLLLPHSAKAQDAAGAPVDGSVARPGDLVIWNDDSHSAIYAGHGQIFHAPQPGGRVELVPIFTDAVHFVRVARD
jgi:cell wall-associated NlpC family hydrolase